MVDRSKISAHTSALVEIIEFQGLMKALDHDQIASLYVKSVRSTTQIAEQLGCSKSLVVTTLKRRGLLRRKGPAQTDPNNYRSALPPYGNRVVDGRLVIHPAELKVCRLIVDLIDRQGFNYCRTAQALTRKAIKNRQGRSTWHHYTVSRIYLRWKDKL